MHKVGAALQEIASTTVIGFVTLSDDRFQEIAQATKSDQMLNKLLRILMDGWPGRKEEPEDDVLRYCSLRNELSTHQGVIFKGDRVLVRKTLHDKFMEKLHTAYLGVVACS